MEEQKCPEVTEEKAEKSFDQEDLEALLDLFDARLDDRKRQLIKGALRQYSGFRDRRQRTADWVMRNDAAGLCPRTAYDSATADGGEGEVDVKVDSETMSQRDENKRRKRRRLEKCSRLQEHFPFAFASSVTRALEAADEDERTAADILMAQQTTAAEAEGPTEAADDISSVVANASSSSGDSQQSCSSVKKRRREAKPGRCKQQRMADVAGPSRRDDDTAAEEMTAVQKELQKMNSIREKIQQIVAECPNIGTDRLYPRLDECEDLDETVAQIINSYKLYNEVVGEMDEGTPPNDDEYSNEMPAQFVDDFDYPNDPDQPGPSGIRKPSPTLSDVSIPPEMRAFVTTEMRQDISHILSMFPEADPYHVLTERVQNDTQKEAIVDKMMQRGYPKKKDRLTKERKEKRRSDLLDLTTFNVHEFLKVFENPEAHFSDMERPVSAAYSEHARIYLMNRFPNLNGRYILRILEEHNSHFLPAIRTILDHISDVDQTQTTRSKPRRRRKKQVTHRGIQIRLAHDRTEELPWPDEMDEQFFRELHYYHFQDDIRAHQQGEQQQRERELLAARTAGNLEECPICADDECLTADMLQCTDDEKLHRFCRNCVRQHADQRISDGAHRVACMDGGCECEYPTDTLRLLLRPQQVNMLLRRMTREQLLAANLQGMEECPFCDFAIIIENDQERVFRCHNQECLKESCRECKAENHVPLRCAEVENDAELAMRKDVELAMSNALIRICPKCDKRVIKSEGCNKLACPCGTSICYVCREALPKQDPYSHFKERALAAAPFNLVAAFNNNNADILGHQMPMPGQQQPTAVKNANGKKQTCPLHTSMDKVHADVALAAGQEAKKKWLDKQKQTPMANQKSSTANDSVLRKELNVENLVDRQQQHAGGGLADQVLQAMAGNLGDRHDQIYQAMMARMADPVGPQFRRTAIEPNLFAWQPQQLQQLHIPPPMVFDAERAMDDAAALLAERRAADRQMMLNHERLAQQHRQQQQRRLAERVRLERQRNEDAMRQRVVGEAAPAMARRLAALAVQLSAGDWANFVAIIEALEPGVPTDDLNFRNLQPNTQRQLLAFVDGALGKTEKTKDQEPHDERVRKMIVKKEKTVSATTRRKEEAQTRPDRMHERLQEFRMMSRYLEARSPNTMVKVEPTSTAGDERFPISPVSATAHRRDDDDERTERELTVLQVAFVQHVGDQLSGYELDALMEIVHEAGGRFQHSEWQDIRRHLQELDPATFKRMISYTENLPKKSFSQINDRVGVQVENEEQIRGVASSSFVNQQSCCSLRNPSFDSDLSTPASPDAEPAAMDAAETQATMIENRQGELERLRSECKRLDVKLKNSQKQLVKDVKGTTEVKRKGLKELQAVMTERDNVLNELHALEERMLCEEGASERDLGRASVDALRLTDGDIGGAVAEASQMVADKQRRTELQLQKVMAEQPEEANVTPPTATVFQSISPAPIHAGHHAPDRMLMGMFDAPTTSSVRPDMAPWQQPGIWQTALASVPVQRQQQQPSSEPFVAYPAPPPRRAPLTPQDIVQRRYDSLLPERRAAWQRRSFDGEDAEQRTAPPLVQPDMFSRRPDPVHERHYMYPAAPPPQLEPQWQQHCQLYVSDCTAPAAGTTMATAWPIGARRIVTPGMNKNEKLQSISLQARQLQALLSRSSPRLYASRMRALVTHARAVDPRFAADFGELIHLTFQCVVPSLEPVVDEQNFTARLRQLWATFVEALNEASAEVQQETPTEPRPTAPRADWTTTADELQPSLTTAMVACPQMPMAEVRPAEGEEEQQQSTVIIEEIEEENQAEEPAVEARNIFDDRAADDQHRIEVELDFGRREAELQRQTELMTAADDAARENQEEIEVVTNSIDGLERQLNKLRHRHRRLLNDRNRFQRDLEARRLELSDARAQMNLARRQMDLVPAVVEPLADKTADSPNIGVAPRARLNSYRRTSSTTTTQQPTKKMPAVKVDTSSQTSPEVVTLTSDEEGEAPEILFSNVTAKRRRWAALTTTSDTTDTDVGEEKSEKRPEAPIESRELTSFSTASCSTVAKERQPVISAAASPMTQIYRLYDGRGAEPPPAPVAEEGGGGGGGTPQLIQINISLPSTTGIGAGEPTANVYRGDAQPSPTMRRSLSESAAAATDDRTAVIAPFENVSVDHHDEMQMDFEEQQQY